MKLLSLEIYNADTCGGLLDGLSIPFRNDSFDTEKFDPFCLIGPNGSGKSQVLQLIAEIFQATFSSYLPLEETGDSNDALEFKVEYLIKPNTRSTPVHVKIVRKSVKSKKAKILIESLINDKWQTVEPKNVSNLLPAKVVGYTSGGNETLSLPFLSSRAGYAEEVRNSALNNDRKALPILDPRMLFIDYGTNLEVLVANLLLNPEKVKRKLLEAPQLKHLRSFRCVIQLNHPAAPTGGIKLTAELQASIEHLKNCSTCYDYNKKTNSWIFDFFVNKATNNCFKSYWDDGALELYSNFHKLAMLNDLVIPAKARSIFRRNVNNRRFSTQSPEPFEGDKVFRFERVEFVSKKNKVVDYVSLSDGEHQLAQLLGTFCMVADSNVLFLLDEPESHFNPKWRVEFIKNLRNMPTVFGDRSGNKKPTNQDCLITTHSPFVPSDMQREQVLIFKKASSSSIEIRRPEIQTYGSRFDAILAECFEISPPISALPRDEMEDLMKSADKDKIAEVIANMGESSARMLLAAKLARLEKGKA